VRAIVESPWFQTEKQTNGLVFISLFVSLSFEFEKKIKVVQLNGQRRTRI
jgi:hypothetical protein